MEIESRSAKDSLVRKWIYPSIAFLGTIIGLNAGYQPGADESVPANTWQTTMNLQLPEIGRCELSSQVADHKLSFNGLKGFVIAVHQGPEIIYELLVDHKLFRGDLRVPAKGRDRIILFDSVTRQCY